MELHSLPHCITLFAIYFIFGATFTLAGGLKVLERSVPGWFNDQFSKTFLKNVPGIPVAYWSIAILECAVPVLLLISIAKLEFMPGQIPVFLEIAIAVSAVVFGVLGFGLRLVNDFTGTANAFFYFGASLVAQIYLQIFFK